MVKTTVYLPEDLKYALGRVAASRGASEAEVIRAAIQSLVDAEPQPRPRGALFDSRGAFDDIDWSANDHLEGFGED